MSKKEINPFSREKIQQIVNDYTEQSQKEKAKLRKLSDSGKKVKAIVSEHQKAVEAEIALKESTPIDTKICSLDLDTILAKSVVEYKSFFESAPQQFQAFWSSIPQEELAKARMTSEDIDELNDPLYHFCNKHALIKDDSLRSAQCELFLCDARMSALMRKNSSDIAKLEAISGIIDSISESHYYALMNGAINSAFMKSDSAAFDKYAALILAYKSITERLQRTHETVRSNLAAANYSFGRRNMQSLLESMTGFSLSSHMILYAYNNCTKILPADFLKLLQNEAKMDETPRDFLMLTASFITEYNRYHKQEGNVQKTVEFIKKLSAKSRNAKIAEQGYFIERIKKYSELKDHISAMKEFLAEAGLSNRQIDEEKISCAVKAFYDLTADKFFETYPEYLTNLRGEPRTKHHIESDRLKAAQKRLPKGQSNYVPINLPRRGHYS